MRGGGDEVHTRAGRAQLHHLRGSAATLRSRGLFVATKTNEKCDTIDIHLLFIFRLSLFPFFLLLGPFFRPLFRWSIPTYPCVCFGPKPLVRDNTTYRYCAVGRRRMAVAE
eukprot:GHVU01181029.1.p2 GENE.GHVU01181029.1~~GHVU01181029.1.p2  ORF type:complete len:111 (-),score=4.28 GHVU01181029.1:717-1049(-)